MLKVPDSIAAKALELAASTWQVPRRPGVRENSKGVFQVSSIIVGWGKGGGGRVQMFGLQIKSRTHRVASLTGWGAGGIDPWVEIRVGWGQG